MTIREETLAIYVGVDIAKDWIDVFDPKKGHTRVATARLGGFVERLPERACVVLEASGGYERPLLSELRARDISFVRANPRQVRDFARATGRLAKTDRVDAAVLAEMGRALRPAPTVSRSPAARRLAALVARRDDVVATITAEKNRLHQADDPLVRRLIRAQLRLLERHKTKLDQTIEAAVAEDARLARTARLLRSATGMGPALVPALLAGLPELGTLDRRKIASLAGLAPHACDSGHRRGQRRCWGGRAGVRRALYLADFIASRYNPELKAFRQRLADAGKPTKVAITACARKLLTQLNAIVRDDRTYEVRAA